LKQELIRTKVGQKCVLIIVGKSVKKEFIKILKGLIEITRRLLEEDWTGFN